MAKKLLHPIVISVINLIALILGLKAYAQNYHATVGALNSVFNPPANIHGIICEAMTGNDGIACRNGVSAARWMAEKHARRAGKYLGCVDGYVQGIWEGYQKGKKPTQGDVPRCSNLCSGK